MKGGLAGGWYMLELRAEFQGLWLRGWASLAGNTLADRADLDLYCGRMFKRLLWVENPCELVLVFDQSGSSMFQLSHFCLARVSARFAVSRMAQKLNAMHPRYRMEWRAGRDISFRVDPCVLWSDYCALFGGSANLPGYDEWLQRFDPASSAMTEALHGLVSKLSHKPLISLILITSDQTVHGLKRAIDSVCAQAYGNWELFIPASRVCCPNSLALLQDYASADSRIRVVVSSDGLASGGLLELIGGRWLGLVDAAGVLAESALYCIAEAVDSVSDVGLLYADYDQMDAKGRRTDHCFQGDWNLDLFYSQNTFAHFSVYRTDVVKELGGLRAEFGPAMQYDLALRYIERLGISKIIHIARVLYHHSLKIALPPVDLARSVKEVEALSEHFARTGARARVEPLGYGYRIHYALPERPPLVSLIIPTRNGLGLLRQCIGSILGKTTYPNYEILIVDNGSDDRATLSYFQSLATDTRIRILSDPRPFNYSALNNAAVAQARGEVVALINNDIEVISPDWLSEMVSHALRPAVGAVGARLWYPDDTIQHAGVVLGIFGVAGHVHRFLPRGELGYCQRAALTQSLSAVTGACLVVRKALYERVGGMNEQDLAVACNDVDLCLRLREAGYRTIWTPFAELYHHESASRGTDDTAEKRARAAREVAYMQQRWGDILLNDPAYSPNLTLDAEDFSLAWPPRVTPLGLVGDS